MLTDEPVVAFVATTDLERARLFYGDVLGLRVREVTPFAVVLSAPDVTVRVTLVDELRPQPFTVLGWTVTDVRGMLLRLGARGVQPLRFEGLAQDADGVWTTPGGDLVAWFADPDENVLSLTELRGVVAG